MTTRKETITFIEDQLSALRGVRTRAMFGEYALYCREKVVALICDDMVYVKQTAPGAALVEGRFEMAPAYPGAKPSMLLNEDVLEDRTLFARLVDVTAEALPAKKRKIA